MKINGKFKSILAATLVSAIVILTFWNLNTANFLTLDDPFLVFSNPMVKNFDLKAIWSSSLIGLYHPLTTISWAIDYAFWGANAKAFHLSNVAYHIVNCVLVFIFLQTLLKDRTWAVIFVTLLFAVHPIKVEPVAWVSARKDLVFTLFFLIGLVAYQQYLCSNRRLALFWTVLAFVLSLLSKPMAVSFPIIIYLLDLWDEPKLWLKRLVQKIPLILISAIAISGNAIVQRSVSNITGSYVSINSIFTAIKGLAFSFILLFKPSELCAFYDKNSITFNLFDFTIVGLYVFILFIASTYRRSLLFPIILLNTAFVVSIMPALKVVGFGDDSLTNDRYLYLSSLPLFILLALALDMLTQHFKKISRQLGGIFLLLLTLPLCTWSQQLVPNWKNTTALWDRIAKINPNSPRPYAMLGAFYLNYGYIPQAVANFSKSYQLNPRNITIAALYGQSLVLYQKFDEAKQVFKEALAIAPQDAELFASIGMYLTEIGQYQDAEKFLIDAQKGSPRITTVENASLRFRALTSLGILYLKTNRLDDARIALETATAMNYDDALSYYHLGYYYSQVARWDDAIRLYQRTLSLSPSLADAYIGLGIVYWNKNDFKQAQENFEKAVAVNPKHAFANSNLGNFYRQKGNFVMAKKYYLQALELDPTVANAHLGLALIYASEGDSMLAEYHKQAAERPKPTTTN